MKPFGVQSAADRRTVVHTVARLKHGGISRQLSDLLHHFDHRQRRHVVCSLSTPRAFMAEVESSGTPIVDLGHTRGRSRARLVFRLRTLLKKLRADIVHTNMEFDSRVVALATFGMDVRILSTLHYSVVDLTTFSARLPYRVSAASRGTFFTVVSRPYLDAWLGTGLIPASRISVVPNGTDLSRMNDRPSTAELDAVRRAHGIPRGWNVILSAARMESVKGQHLLLPVMHRLLREHPNTILLIAGDGSSRPELERLVASQRLSQNVRLLGGVDNVPMLLHMADLFVCPSFAESFGIAYLEAMATGTPAVGWAIPTRKWLTKEAAREVLVQPGDTYAMAERASVLLDDSRYAAAIGRQLQERSRSFDISKTAAHFEELYTELLTG